MPSKRPTKRDAELYLELVQTFNSPRTREAHEWFAKEFTAKSYKEFVSKYPMGSKEFGYLSTILAEFEVAGSFISFGLLNEDLYFDNSGIGFSWERLEPVVTGWRKAARPQLWENAVWLAERQKRWTKSVWKPDLKWKKT